MNKAREEAGGLAQDMGDVLTYALYPVTGMRFLKVKYGKESPPNQAMAQSPVVQPEPTQPAPSPRARTFNIFLGGRSFQVMVDPVDGAGPPPPSRPEPRPASTVQARPRPAAQPAVTPQPSVAAPKPSAASEEAVLTSPMPGVVLRYTVEVGQEVKAGETAVVLEAMKMENALPAPADGVVKRLCTGPGAKVARGADLVTIGPAEGPPV
jgi:oxaloacetate decarboxylase alpha subunit/pyruvate carboxylase subunit B